jgi:hypothetical protein
MSRFFFHLRGGGLDFPDPVGTDCGGAADARRYALRLAEDLVAADEIGPHLPPTAYVDVEDEQLRPVFMLPLRSSVSER